jgi:D-alanyl-lipoteichoic acid acyltransferase DltB (MBOAT superfamily)
MLFDSFYYFIFLGVIFLLYYTLSNKYRWAVILLGSLFFIGYLSPSLVYFTLLFAVVNYFLGLGIEICYRNKWRKKIFWFGIILNVGLLSFYKYINFFLENVNFILSIFPEKPSIPYLSLIIPVGISYYTFQALGYLIRINRGSEKAERHFGYFASYLLFFPKFLAGPVERSNHFFPQINAPIKFESNNISDGLRLFLWGLFKKVVIANNLVEPVMMVHNDVQNYSGIPLLVVMFLQTIHLYADFSGYTDMALGSAKILGINIIDNFNRPFFAKNVGELWRRWHISLSSWCNDFIFTPFIVKYRKMGNKAAIIGIFLTFFVIGIWHGANWTYVVLGILQGIAISYEFYTKRSRIKIASKLPPRFVVLASRILTFVFFSFSLIFFNSPSISDAWYFITHLFTDVQFQLTGHDFIYDKLGFFTGLIAFLILLGIESYIEKGKSLYQHFLNKPRYVRWAGYYVLIFLVYYFSGGQETFVYLQF